MKHLLASTCLVVGLMAMTGAARAECGNVTIASMNWQSAEVLAALDKFILSEGYGCNAEVIVGDTVPTITSMTEKGDPDLAPEGWVDLLPDVVNRGIEEGKLSVRLSRSPTVLFRAGGSRNTLLTRIPTSRPSMTSSSTRNCSPIRKTRARAPCTMARKAGAARS